MNRPNAPIRDPAWARSAPARSAFTLIELIICMAILAILISLLLPAARHAVGSARGFKCQMSQRSVAFDFGLFTDDSLHPPRGEDDLVSPRVVPKGQFRLETFINSQYGLNEFWFDTYGNQATTNLPDACGRDPMRCAEVKGELTLYRGMPCTSAGAVQPPANVSYGFNARLDRSEARWLRGQTGPLGLNAAILERGGVSPDRIPLAWDVDGATAAQRFQNPLFSAPALDSRLLYIGNVRWFPALRHNRGLNAAFIDGHVVATRKPLAEDWAWDFDPAGPR